MKPVQRARDLRPDKNCLHKGVWADSGAGKTYMMNEVHKDSQVASIMVAQPKDEDDYDLYGVKTESKADLKKKLEQGKKIHFNPPSNGKQFLKELNAIYEVAKEVDVEVVIFVDEVHRVSHISTKQDSSNMAFGDMMTDGRGHGVRFMIATQSLNRFSNKTGRVVVGACQEHIFMQINEMEKGFYNYYNFPWQKMKDEINEIPYAGIRYRKGQPLSDPFRLKT
jgi:intracellular sulfur oxidation DsrE/DsrF family protein